MWFDLETLCKTVADHGRATRVLVAAARGSTPREAGVSMLVWEDGSQGTIGGGELEHRAMLAARGFLKQSGDWLRMLQRVPLGPTLGQCCGGAVTLLFEVYSATECNTIRAASARTDVFSRAVCAGDGPRNRPDASPGLRGGLMSEPFSGRGEALWIFGAGHVGRALAATLAPLDFDITLVDAAPERFPGTLPLGVHPLIAADPATVVPFAPPDARHFVMMHAHALDLEICHRLLIHGFRSAGLIGSATKWARFRKKLLTLGHAPGTIARITCPIGQPGFGKSPQAIAVGVAAGLLSGREMVKPASVPNIEEYAS